MDINTLWYQKSKRVWLLWPLALLFAFVSACRRWLFKAGLKKRSHPGAFVIVVGNISVGGNGKTPVVLAITEHFKRKGLKPGVLSRGYGGTMQHHPYRVMPGDDAAVCGDEPALIAGRTGVPVVIDPVRARGAKMLAEELHCDVIICDDGLQHYALERDLELVVMDSRGTGNGHLLPMGPLREKPWRLASVDGIILNGNADLTALQQQLTLPPAFNLTLEGRYFCNVLEPARKTGIQDVCAKSGIHALAGIGHPDRFFRQLEMYGITLSSTQPLPDHHHFTAADIPPDTVVMTEKDAVKARAFAHEDCWYLPVDAVLPEEFYDLLDTRFEAGRRINNEL